MKRTHNLALALTIALGAAACGDSTGPGDSPRQVGVSFALAADAANGSANEITVNGTNGTLTIHGIWLVVDELELEGGDGVDCNDECEFETGPFFMQVPLTGSTVAVALDYVPAGTYTEFEFEVDDLDISDGEDDDQSHVNTLFTQILAQQPDWPRDASMLVTGIFTPTGGVGVPFRTYFDADVEIEMDLNPPLTVGSDGVASVIVELDPARWFRDANGTVTNLSQWDFGTTGAILEFETEIENGFDSASVEHDDD